MADYWLAANNLNPNIDNSGIVNFADFAILAEDWRQTADNQPGDLNKDNTVDTKDLAIMSEAWLSNGGEARWNPDYDISNPNDGIINGLDIFMLCENWLIDCDANPYNPACVPK